MKHKDVDDFAKAIKAHRDAGSICIGANLLLTPAELAAGDYKAIIATKAQNVVDSLIASATAQADARRAHST